MISLAILSALAASVARAELRIEGAVTDAGGAPVAGAMLTFRAGDPAHSLSVFAGRRRRLPLAGARERGAVGRARAPHRLEGSARHGAGARPGSARRARARARDRSGAGRRAAAREPLVPARARAARRPAQREELKRQCTYCHQQGSAATRVRARRRGVAQGAGADGAHGRHALERSARASCPTLFNAAYEPASAVAALTARMHEPDFAPPPAAEARRAVIEEWELGGRASMQHDVTCTRTAALLGRHEPGPALPARSERRLGRARSLGHPARRSAARRRLRERRRRRSRRPRTRTSGPHSLQVAPDGAIWITLALGNQLARFDPVTERFEVRAARARLLPAHAALRCARAHLVHDRGVESPRHVRPRDARAARAAAAGARSRRRR